MARPNVLCLSCGTQNPADRERCSECGARLETFAALTKGGSERKPFAFGWFAGLLGAYAVLLGIVLVVLPLVVRSYDPQGLPGLAIAIAIWFLGGFAGGRVAADRRYVEPAVAAAITAAVFVPYVAHISDVRALETGGYVVAGLLGVLSAGLGAFLGDAIAPAAAKAARRT